jgi:hypothetical protein
MACVSLGLARLIPMNPVAGREIIWSRAPVPIAPAAD